MNRTFNIGAWVAPGASTPGFLLRHGKTYHGRKTWTFPHRRWLSELSFDHPAQQIVFQDYIHAVEDGEARRKALVPQWSLAPLVAALQNDLPPENRTN